jgi:hypothetical protein
LIISASAVVVCSTMTFAILLVVREMRRAVESVDLVCEAIDDAFATKGDVPSLFGPSVRSPAVPADAASSSGADDERALLREWASLADGGASDGLSDGSAPDLAGGVRRLGWLPSPWRDVPAGAERELAGFLASLPPERAAILFAFAFGFAEEDRCEAAETARRTLVGALGLISETTAKRILLDVGGLSSCDKDAVASVAAALESEVIAPAAERIRFKNPGAAIAGIMNRADRTLENRLMCVLEEADVALAERVKGEMFAFEDLIRIDDCGVQVLLRSVEKDTLALALKGATDVVRDLFLRNLSERAGKMLAEDMRAMGPVFLRDVDRAQGSVVEMALALAAGGQLVISDGGEGAELIY